MAENPDFRFQAYIRNQNIELAGKRLNLTECNIYSN